jgi:DNA-binding response OmpR family regulator/curved DNA-binding protein CbpA
MAPPMAGYVLIVESDPELQKRIGEALREARYEIAAETEAAWAQRSTAVRTPDAIVIDTRLRDGDGFRLAEDLRRAPETKDTPLFFVASTYRGAGHRTEARRRFAPAEYLPTPLDVNRLLALLLETVPPGEGAVVPARPDLAEPAGGGNGQSAGALRDPAQELERRNVERSARALVAEKAEMHGTLRRTPFARLLQRLYTRRASGSLLLLNGETKKIVAFTDGYPVSVRSNVLGECLGQILLAQRLINEKTLAQSVTRMQREKRQQGQILVEMGALSPYNLERALHAQAEAKLLEIFAWRDGKFMFKEGGDPPRDPLRLEAPPASLILEGIRRHYDPSRQRAVLESYVGQFVTLSPDPTLRLQEMTADPTDLAFIDTLDGTERLEKVLDGAQIPREKARLLLVALSEAGMIRPKEASVRRRGLPAPHGASATPGAVVAPVAAQPPAPLPAAQLSLVAKTVRSQDYFWALGVPRNVTSADADRAYETLARSFHADRYRNGSEDDRRLAKEIFDRLAEAHRVLSDPARRRAYINRLARADDRAEHPERGDSRPLPEPGPAPSLASNAAARELYDAGIEHLRVRRHHEAVEAFRQAARLVPNEAEYRAALGWALFREAPADARAGRAALAELRRALQLDARNRRAYEYLAQLYAQTGQPELATRELERLLAVDPGAAEAAEELRRLRDATPSR